MLSCIVANGWLFPLSARAAKECQAAGYKVLTRNLDTNNRRTLAKLKIYDNLADVKVQISKDTGFST